MERKEVYTAIDTERDYQDNLWQHTVSSGGKSTCYTAGDRTIDEFAMYISAQTNKLIDVCGTSDDPKEKLEIFIKIAALCVSCGETHGLPIRENIADNEK